MELQNSPASAATAANRRGAKAALEAGGMLARLAERQSDGGAFQSNPVKIQWLGEGAPTWDSARREEERRVKRSCGANLEQIQFADQDLKSNSTGGEKGLNPEGVCLTAAQKSHFTLSPRREEDSHHKRLRTLEGGGGKEVSECVSTAPNSPTLKHPLLPPHLPERGIVKNRPQAFQINGRNGVDGLQK